MISSVAQPAERTASSWSSTDGLLLAENLHRTANEIAAALAAMRLVRSGRAAIDRDALLDHAIDRLEGFAQVHQLLARPAVGMLDVGPELERLCRGLVAARLPPNVGQVTLRLASVELPATSAHGLLLVAAELVANAIRHAFVRKGGQLTVALARSDDEAFLCVVDTGQGVQASRATAGTGQGSGIVAGLLDRLGGSMERRSGATGTAVRVRVPYGRAG